MENGGFTGIRLGVLTRERDPHSLIAYRESLLEEFANAGVSLVQFSEQGSIPHKCDLVWEPGGGMRRVPQVLQSCRKPLIVTMHGLAPFSLKSKEVVGSLREALTLRKLKIAILNDWRVLRGRIGALIAVSGYGAEEVRRVLGIPNDKIVVAYHGVNRGIFHAERIEEDGRIAPYFLHVSQFQPKKNLERLLAAYKRLNGRDRPKLLAVVPGFSVKSCKIQVPRDVILYEDAITHNELATLYQRAIAFVFPSLHETFGLPIIEAMSCACPVITSNQTGCREVAGGAALLVNPRSVKEIAGGMQAILDDARLRQRLIERGMCRAMEFTWSNSARRHLEVFGTVVARESGRT